MTEGPRLAHPVRAGHRPAAWVVLVVVLVAHLYALYAPGSPEPTGPDIPGLDKVVHVLLFGVPAFWIRRITTAWWPAAVLVAHAPISEVVQHLFIPLRTGDPLDLLADLVGVALGVWAAGATRRSGRRRARTSSTTRAAP